ncbi:2053_t:CDS:10 [Funneliformis mosseae]|uniref:2053_t:CDS:1 n=1 Tax=Funneliformis mosseae TaxID=27381 RepID=A0A9N9F8W6_FUNMO|nr:2053_t:CDS:10 [Funneliformis mosseae]
MSRFTPSKTLFKDSKEIDNYVLHNFGKKPTSIQIKHYWNSIAKLYFNLGNYSMTAEFLFRLLLISPQNYEALELLGTTYKKQEKLSSALEYYERALLTPNAPQTLAYDAAELCIQLAKMQKEESEIKRLTTKALHWIERSRSLNNNKYDILAIQLLQKTYAILVRYAEKQLDKRSCLKRREGMPPVVTIKWIDDSVKDLISLEETFIDPSLQILLTKSLLKIQDYQRAWKHITQRRYNFVDSLEWNNFIKSTFSKLKLEATIDNQKDPLHEPTELIFFAHDNVVRLSLSLFREESVRLVKEFSDSVKTWGIPESQNLQLVEKWTRFQQEYQSRSLRHDGYFQLYLVSSDLVQFQNASIIQKNQYHLNAAYLKFKSCLYFRRETFRDPTRPISHFIYLMCQRISDVSHQLLVLLQCFDYLWLNKNDEANVIFRSHSKNDDATQNFVLPGHKKFLKNLHREVGKKSLTELNMLKWLSKTALQIDKIAFCAPYDLDRFLMISAWYIENGEIRDFLRLIFPNLQDCLKMKEPRKAANVQESPIKAITTLFENVSSLDQLGTNWEEFLSKRVVTTRKSSIVEIPTLVDIEFFLLILLIQRQYHCINRLGAKTLGQILYLTSRGCWKTSVNQKRFWQTLLSFYGKNDPDKRIYASNLMPNEEFTQCLREIRGDINIRDYDFYDDQGKLIVNLQKDLFLIMAVLYESMIHHHHRSRFVEGLLCVETYQNWDQNISKKEPTSFSLYEKHERFFILDTEIKEPGYRVFIPDNNDLGPNDLTEHLSTIFNLHDESTIQQNDSVNCQFDASIDDIDTFLEENSSTDQIDISFENESKVDDCDSDGEYVQTSMENNLDIFAEPLNQEANLISDESINEEKSVLSDFFVDISEGENEESDEEDEENEDENEESDEDENENLYEEENLEDDESLDDDLNLINDENLNDDLNLNDNENLNDDLNLNDNENLNDDLNLNDDENLDDEEVLEEQFHSMNVTSQGNMPVHEKPLIGADTSFSAIDKRFEEDWEVSMIRNVEDGVKTDLLKEITEGSSQENKVDDKNDENLIGQLPILPITDEVNLEIEDTNPS